MIARQPATVTTELALQLVVADGPGLSVEAVVSYDARDPYAVRVGFRTGAEDLVEWTFARQLLTDGVTQAAGEGDVRVWPTVVDPTRGEPQVVCLSLSSPSGTALFEAPLGFLVEFLTRTYEAVPTGAESRFVDIDAELALLLWSGAEE